MDDYFTHTVTDAGLFARHHAPEWDDRPTLAELEREEHDAQREDWEMAQCSANVGGDPVSGCDNPATHGDYCEVHSLFDIDDDGEWSQ